jgi:thiamine biosynthesis lipoprotein
MDEPVAMRATDGSGRLISLGVLRNGAAAGSAVEGAAGSHFDGRSRSMLAFRRAATVIAPHCAIADALTKIVLSDPPAAEPVLQRFGATACVIDAEGSVHRWGALT